MMTTSGRLVSVAAALALVAGLATRALTQDEPEVGSEDERAIRQVVQLYFDGIIKYDEASLRKAFHADAYVIGTDEKGALDSEPFQEWVLYTRGKAPDPTGRENKIVSIDITGRAATVKTDLDWPHVHYVDYLSLLKIEGEWKIVNKIWHREKP